MSVPARVAVVMGSKSDLDVVSGALELLDRFGVPRTARILSAHRTPDEAAAFASGLAASGVKAVICAAGMAAHLAGVFAAHTMLPVIGVPVPSEPFKGLDSLLSTVQMPPGIPVATMGAGKSGAKNAALFAVAILALTDPELAEKLAAFRAEQTAQVLAADRELNV